MQLRGGGKAGLAHIQEGSNGGAAKGRPSSWRSAENEGVFSPDWKELPKCIEFYSCSPVEISFIVPNK